MNLGGPTYHGEPLDQGLLIPRRYVDGEGYAELRCGGTRVLLSYTVLSWLSGLVDLRGFVGDFQVMSDTVHALHAITGEAAVGRIPAENTAPNIAPNTAPPKENVNGLGLKPTREYGAELATSGRNKRSVWTIATTPFPDAHFAVMPEDLVTPCILAGTSAARVLPAVRAAVGAGGGARRTEVRPVDAEERSVCRDGAGQSIDRKPSTGLA